MEQTLVLCGFMGCGKTAVGRRLRAMTGRPFTDLDEYIEQQAGRTVTEIFALYGEGCFRQMETDALRVLAQKPGGILAAGGGTLTFPQNVEILRGAGCVIVLIDTPLPVIEKRLARDATRPLLNRPDKAEAMRSLYTARLPLYRAAATVTVSGDHSPDAVARAILLTCKEPDK